MLRIRTRIGFYLAAAAVFLALAPKPAQAAVRYNHSISLLSDGNLLIVGGQTAAAAFLSTVEIYITTSATLTSRASMTVARASHTATLLPDGRLLVSGGVSSGADVANCHSGGNSVCSRGALYDPKTNTWSNTTTEMSFPRYNHTATLLPSGKVLIVGGQTVTGVAATVTQDCDLFDPATNSYQSSNCGGGGQLQMGRAAHTASLLHNGRVFVAGGYVSGASSFSVTTEIYDPVTDAWSAGPALIQARAWHTATQMGNQRVLLAGGFNGLNVKENRGILETTEIYDPNSNTLTPGAALAARKMFHTANLTGEGRVNLYGGLGNITTSYFGPSLSFKANSSLVMTQVGTSWLEAAVSGAASSLIVQPDTVLSAGVTGRVVEGEIDFSSPTITMGDFKVDLTYPGGTKATIPGATIDAGKLKDQTFTINNANGALGGAAHFIPQSKSAVREAQISGGGTVTTAGPIPGSTKVNLTGGSLSLTVRFPMPQANDGGTLIAGAAIITGGTISKASDELNQGFDISLTTGRSNISGTVGYDSTDGYYVDIPLSFTNIGGTITSSTSTTINTPVSVGGLYLTGLQVLLNYIISPVKMDDVSFGYDIATVTIRSMIFSDQERYQPNQNQWTFGVPGDTRFNHAETLLPNGDEVVFGGRTCSDRPTCSAFNFSAVGGPLAYILLQEGETPWSPVAPLFDARSNHTLTVIPQTGKILAVGGANASTTLDTSEVYDPVSHTWSRSGNMHNRRSHHTATLLPNGTILAAGGFTPLAGSTGATKSAEIYYPQTGTWVETAPMSSSRTFHAAVLLPDGNPMMLGGFTNGQYLSSTEVFFSTAHRWINGPSIGGGAGEARANFTATLLRDGRVFVVGGVNASNGVLNTTWLFNPLTWTWSAGANLNTGRHSHTATLLRDGRVFVVGGNSGLGEIGKAEIYDPVANTWTRTTAAPISGNDLGIPRLNHTATLLPDGKILIVGGFTAIGGPIIYSEGFDVDFSTFQMQGKINGARGDHASILMPDGWLLNVGGFDGLNYKDTAEIQYYGANPDAVTLAGGQSRRPAITDVVPAIFRPGSQVTVKGTNLMGMSEASGGGGGSANSHHSHPRLYMQRADAASTSANDSGWMVDLTSATFDSGINTWSKMNSSITFTVPYTSATLPLGWYHVRVAANSQFSESRTIQVGPPVPTAAPGVPSGNAVGPSSIVWTWGAAAGTFDGYSVYSATSGIFLSTVPKSGGATESWLETGLGPDTSSLIKVAAYNIAGDGTVVPATITVLTPVSAINNLQGIAQTERSIFWSWDPVSGASAYNVHSATTGVFLSSPTVPSYTQTLLSTNSAASVYIRAVMPGGLGVLSPAVTAYTLAAQPFAGQPGMASVTTGSFSAQWLANTNPANTKYHLQLWIGTSTTGVPFQISSITALSAGITPLDPNTLHTIQVAAYNEDGKYTGFTLLGSTYTLAKPPLNARVTSADASTIGLAWDANNNPGDTIYQVLYSSDNFATSFSTHIAFSVGYTSTTASVTGLLTGLNYTVRVTARNNYGQETSAASTQAYTDNGGGPTGSLILNTGTTVYASLSGTLINGRRFTMSVYPGTFDSADRVFITTAAAANVGGKCGAIDAAVHITHALGEQPKVPVDIGIEYNPADGALGATATLGIVRYDPYSGNCVPMQSWVDTLNKVVYARINHFSFFQVQQLTPSASVGEARVFPNPLYTSRQGYFTFASLPGGTRIRVYTIHGEEVFDGTANASGVLAWRAENMVGRPVASGLYLAVFEAGGNKKILKLAVVR